MANTPPSGGGGTGDSSSAGDGDDGGSFVEGWADLAVPDAIESLQSVSGQLVTIAKNPKNFILGTLLSAMVGAILDVWSFVIDDVVQPIFFGAGPGYESGELVGLEDIPLIFWNVITGPFETIGQSILDTLGILETTTESLASGLGIASFPITVGFIVLTLIAAQRVAGTLSRATLTSIPLIGSALEVFIFE